MNYITFAEAMKESKEGKLVRCYFKDDGYLNLFGYDDLIEVTGMDKYSFKDLFDGKWKVLIEGQIEANF